MDLLVLGPVEVHDGGRRLDLGPPKQRALLALLAARADEVVAVDTLVDQLWDGRPPRQAEAGLQAYVSNLRKVLEPGRDPRAPAAVLRTLPPGYVLGTAELGLDARRFQDLTDRGRQALAAGDGAAAAALLRAALDLWRGQAYADVRDVPGIAPEAGRLDQLRLAATEDLAEARVAAGQAATAAADLEPFVAGHPLRERAWRLLALALYRCDRQGDALAALARARTHLQEELGIDPGPALQELELAILRQDPALEPAGSPLRSPLESPATGSTGSTASTAAPPRVPEAPTPAVPPQRGPFVGRREELAALHAAWTAATGRGGVVLVEGEPGIGKTRLVEELAATVPAPVLWGRCPEHEAAPSLWPWEAAVRALARLRPEVAVPPAVAALLQEAPGVQPPDARDVQDAAGARLRLYDAVTAYLAAAAPAVVVLDDVQWADAASTRLLVHVAASAPAGVLLVATLRTHEASPLTATLAALARAGARRIVLGGLAEADVRTLVGAVTGADPGPAGARAMRARTGGNALFVTLAGAGDGAPGSAGTPRELRDVVLQRLAGLPPEAADLLRVAAVAGDDVEVDVVAEVAGLGVDDVLDGLDAALAAGLLREDDTPLGTYRFAHALVREALDGEHSRLRRARLHRRYAEATEHLHGADDERAGRIARHWLAAAELGPDCARAALTQSARAAREAMRRHSPEDAVAAWQGCLLAEQLAGGARDQRFEALVGLLEAHYAAGDHAEGLALLDTVLDAADGDPRRITSAAVAALGQTPWYPFDYGVVPRRLLAALEDAVPRLSPGSPDRALALGCLGALQCHAGLTDASPATSAAAVAAALEVAEHAATDLLARVLFLRLLALTGVDHVEDCLETARQLLALPSPPPALAVAARMLEVSSLVALAQVPEAERLLATLPVEVAAVRSPTLAVQHAFLRSAVLAFRGRVDEAEALATSTYAPLAPLGIGHVLATWTTQRCDWALQSGGLAGLTADLAAVRERTGIEGYGASHALALLDAGVPEQARAVLATVRIPPRDYTWMGTVIGMLLAARALGEREQLARLRELLVPYRRRLAVLGSGTAVLGAVAGHLGEAALALGDVASARDDLTLALELLEPAGTPFWTASVRDALRRCEEAARGPAPTSGETPTGTPSAGPGGRQVDADR